MSEVTLGRVIRRNRGIWCGYTGATCDVPLLRFGHRFLSRAARLRGDHDMYPPIKATTTHLRRMTSGAVAQISAPCIKKCVRPNHNELSR